MGVLCAVLVAQLQEGCGGLKRDMFTRGREVYNFKRAIDRVDSHNLYECENVKDWSAELHGERGEI